MKRIAGCFALALLLAGCSSQSPGASPYGTTTASASGSAVTWLQVPSDLAPSGAAGEFDSAAFLEKIDANGGTWKKQIESKSAFAKTGTLDFFANPQDCQIGVYPNIQTALNQKDQSVSMLPNWLANFEGFGVLLAAQSWKADCGQALAGALEFTGTDFGANPGVKVWTATQKNVIACLQKHAACLEELGLAYPVPQTTSVKPHLGLLKQVIDTGLCSGDGWETDEGINSCNYGTDQLLSLFADNELIFDQVASTDWETGQHLLVGEGWILFNQSKDDPKILVAAQKIIGGTLVSR